MHSHELSIPIHDLDAGGKQFRFALRPGWLRGALEGTDVTTSEESEGSLDVRVSKSGTDVVVTGTMDVQVQVPCARCLESAEVHVHEPIAVLMVPAAHHAHHHESSERATKDAKAPGKDRASAHGRADDDGDLEGDGEEADVLPYDGDTVVLDHLVRDELLLAIPMIPLCSEQCPGIRQPSQEHPPKDQERPAEAGLATEIDPRLAPLLKLKGKS
jgi:uncharacterized protein